MIHGAPVGTKTTAAGVSSIMRSGGGLMGFSLIAVLCLEPAVIDTPLRSSRHITVLSSHLVQLFAPPLPTRSGLRAQRAPAQRVRSMAQRVGGAMSAIAPLLEDERKQTEVA